MNYLQIIEENKHNVKKGQEFTTESKFFRALGLEGKYKSNELLAIRRAISCWFEYEKIQEGKNAVKITKKYNKKRDNNKIKSKFSDIEEIMVHMLATCDEVIDGEITWVVSKGKLTTEVGLCNPNMSVIAHNQDFFTEELNIDKKLLMVLCNDIYNLNRSVIVNYLQKLRNARQIMFNQAHKVVTNEIPWEDRLATKEEEELILNAERFALMKLKVKNINTIYFSGMEQAFRSLVEQYLKTQEAEFIQYYSVYIIIPSEDFRKQVLTKKKLLQKQKKVNENRINQFTEKHYKLNKEVIEKAQSRIIAHVLEGKTLGFGRSKDGKNIEEEINTQANLLNMIERFVEVAIDINCPTVYVVNYRWVNESTEDGEIKSSKIREILKKTDI